MSMGEWAQMQTNFTKCFLTNLLSDNDDERRIDESVERCQPDVGVVRRFSQLNCGVEQLQHIP